jgi:shikimate dehydrogenase
MKTYGLLGEHLSHSYSKDIHARLADYPYIMTEVAPENLDSFMRSCPLDGMNVTIPYKKAVLPYCSALTDRARRIGSVNTLTKLPDGTFFGDNTDYAGFMYMMRRAGISVKGKKVLVLGSGGASLAVKAALEDMEASKIITISRSGEDNYDNISRHSDADVIVNTTPVGMYPNGGQSPVELSIFPNLSGVADIIFNPAVTRLMFDAECRGIPTAGGLSMLVAQAAEASYRFCGRRFGAKICDRITADIARQMKNITLVGMPGCGKSTAGARLASLTGRDFIDTDKVIEQEAGMTIPEIFAVRGEEGFRALEHDVLCRVCAQSGKIIATGGGVLTREENIYPIRQNSTVIFLNRDITKLATAGRPISQSRSAADIFKERYPLYRRWSDGTVRCRTVRQTAENVLKLCGMYDEKKHGRSAASSQKSKHKGGSGK